MLFSSGYCLDGKSDTPKLREWARDSICSDILWTTLDQPFQLLRESSMLLECRLQSIQLGILAKADCQLESMLRSCLLSALQHWGMQKAESVDKGLLLLLEVPMKYSEQFNFVSWIFHQGKLVGLTVKRDNNSCPSNRLKSFNCKNKGAEYLVYSMVSYKNHNDDDVSILTNHWRSWHACHITCPGN